MFKLIVVTLAAFFIILQAFGDSSRRPVVTREAPAALTLASMIGLGEKIEETSLAPEPLLSDAEAIALAVEAGERVRKEKNSGPQAVTLRGVPEVIKVAAVTPDQSEVPVVEVAPVAKWFVTGTRVNLRQGPGTSNAVVTQVTLGTEAEVIDSRNGWMQIVTTDGAATGWISGKFLKEQAPS